GTTYAFTYDGPGSSLSKATVIVPAGEFSGGELTTTYCYPNIQYSDGSCPLVPMQPDPCPSVSFGQPDPTCYSDQFLPRSVTVKDGSGTSAEERTTTFRYNNGKLTTTTNALNKDTLS